MVWIKICGITNNSDAGIAARCGADALGFIFSTDSPRKISLEAASSILDHLRNISENNDTKNGEDKSNRIGAVKKVGVFVNEDMEKVVSFSRQLKLDYIQFSGDESVDYIMKLKKELPGIKVIKAIRIESDAWTQSKKIKKTADEFSILADHILMDSYHPSKYGGTGETVDQETAKIFSSIQGFILSGGLDHLNIRETIRNIKPFGIDVSSRLESSPGKKDHQLVRSFIEEARSTSEAGPLN